MGAVINKSVKRIPTDNYAICFPFLGKGLGFWYLKGTYSSQTGGFGIFSSIATAYGAKKFSTKQKTRKQLIAFIIKTF